MDILRIVLRGSYLRRSLWMSAIVGSILNCINQPAVLLGDADLHWPKLLLTYCVPFLVTTYGAYSAIREQRRVCE